jgi:uracil-DNA glycosylase
MLDALLAEIRACHACRDLPLGPRPILRGKSSARLLIASQAPSPRVHVSGLPFDDPSGDRLRNWLGVDRATFYDESRIAIIPMGFCYPGRDDKGGDLPPRKECAKLWRTRLFEALPDFDLTLTIGHYAQAWHLGKKMPMTETVRDYRAYLPKFFPLPHPSWRNTGWLKRNPWFEAQALPELRARVAGLL